MISAYFQSDGHSPLSIDVLKIMYKGVQSSYDNNRRTAEGMPSGLRVNLLGSLHMNFRTSSGYMVMLDNSSVVRIFIAGKFMSSSINTEENCWFSILSINQSINQSAFILPNTKKEKKNIIIRNITVRAGETHKKTARHSLT